MYVNSCVFGGYGLNPFSSSFFFVVVVVVVVHCMCFIHFSAAFCTAHCALDLARDHAP